MNATTMAGILALGAWALPAAAQLPAEISGTWRNPAQTGHGIMLEILDEQSSLGGWFVYDPAGNPMHLYLAGRIEGHRIVSDAYQSRGVRFGSFDPRDHQFPRWGTVTLDFSDCNAGTLSWNADGPAGAGYGSGQMPVTRLTAIAGHTCESLGGDPGSTVLQAGGYAGTWDRASGGSGSRPYPLQAAVDSQGRLWATAEWSAGPTFLGSYGPAPLFIGTPAIREADRIVAEVDVRYGVAFPRHAGAISELVQINVPLVFDLNLTGSATTFSAPELVERFDLAKVPAASDPLRRLPSAPGFEVSQLAGRRFAFDTLGQFFEFRMFVGFEADGSICVGPREFGGPGLVCEFTGSVGTVEPGLSMFSIVLNDTVDPSLSYRGKAWVRGDTGQLVVVANAGIRGMGLVATPE